MEDSNHGRWRFWNMTWKISKLTLSLRTENSGQTHNIQTARQPRVCMTGSIDKGKFDSTMV